MDKNFFKLLDPTNVSTYLNDCEKLVKKSVRKAKRETDPQVLHQCDRCERWVSDSELFTEGLCQECSFPLFI
mgnify:CR=1 FL=1|jgi:hypothetical protein